MIHRVLGILLQEFYITRRSLEVIVDLFFFSVLSLLAFGFVYLFLGQENSTLAGKYLLLGLIFWEVIRICQFSVTVGALWNIWARNLSNMFITPLSVSEYLFALILSGTIKSLIVFFLVSFISLFLFHFNVFQIGAVTLVFSFINLAIFSWSFGIFMLGLIFRFGTRIQALAWGLVFVLQPLSATFFPVKILPPAMQVLAYSLPTTHVFEMARNSLNNTQVNWAAIGIAFAENIFYFALALWVFSRLFAKSKESGQFARNEG
ncbi:MAG: ABC transporter permease [bacterium]|nr:ABC transporter permease [bacterium]